MRMRCSTLTVTVTNIGFPRSRSPSAQAIIKGRPCEPVRLRSSMMTRSSTALPAPALVRTSNLSQPSVE